MNITLNDYQVSIVREGIALEKNITQLGIKEYEKELEEYEKKYSMKTESFLKKYNNAELGDDRKWFDWLFAYKALKHLQEREKLVEGINI